MPSVTCFHVRFTFNWFITLVACAFFILFLRLGFWQLQRAEEKKQMIVAEEALANEKPLPFENLQSESPKAYQRLIIAGKYLPHVFLLDNQHYQHQFGYDVLSPLLLSNGMVVIVDRGWIAGDITRQTFPQVNFPDTMQVLQGSVYYPSNKQWVLGQSLEEKNKNLTVIELLDQQLFTQVLQKKLYPFIIRLDKQDPNGFVREWAIVSMSPERHWGYALQWFAMALALFILYFVLTIKKNNDKTND